MVDCAQHRKGYEMIRRLLDWNENRKQIEFERRLLLAEKVFTEMSEDWASNTEIIRSEAEDVIDGAIEHGVQVDIRELEERLEKHIYPFNPFK